VEDEQQEEERMRWRVIKTTGRGGCGATKDDAKRGEWEADTQVGSWQTREAEEDGYDILLGKNWIMYTHSSVLIPYVTPIFV